MFNVGIWRGTAEQAPPPPPPPLPFFLYGEVEGQLIDQQRRRMLPIDPFLMQRPEKHNLLELI